MNSQPNHEAALTETIREGRAVIVTGTGVSIAASFDATTKQPHPQASWAGLLKDGLKWLKDHKLIDDDIADAQLKLLEKNPQTHRFISAAEDVTDGMGGAKSKHFSDWLKRTIGSIKAHDRSALDALEAIRQQGNLLSTTNYDGLLLSGHSQLAPVTWLDTDALIGVARHWDTGKIIFLHGYWRQPESVVLDWKSYDKIARDERYRQDLAAFWKTSIWVYVGCGVSGLADPDFGLLLERYGERARQAGHWDYCLVRDDQRDEFQAYFDTNRLNIRAIPFGKDYTDLPQYLHSLLPAPVPPAPVTPPSAALASADPKMSARASKIRSLYLKDARRDFEARLAASVHHARFIDLGIQDDPAAIKPAWGYHNPETRQSYDTVAEAFAGCDRRLLLLGSPGSGKTTALLHLAKLLVLEAEQNPEAPIPFVVNLSKFRFERSEGAKLWRGFGEWRGASANGNGNENLDTKLEDWLVSEIAAFPGLSHELARDWIRHGRVAALLDGLDEFNDERRGDLVRLLNSTFLRYYPDLIVVICSRTNEYLVLRSSEETRLQLRRCVQLQPLSDEQIADYLDAAQARALLSALPDDPALRELAKTPLTLSMLVLSYGGLAPSDLPKSGSLSESRHHLFESYVTRMLQRRERRKRNVLFDDSKANDIPVSEYSYHPDLVHRWLGWLALALSARMRTSFSVANIHSILSIGVQPARQPFNFSAVYFTLGVLLSVSLCLIAQLIIPIKSAGLLSYVFIVVSSLLLLPLAASGSREWAGGSLFLRVMYPSIVLLDITAVTRLLCAILPGGISPLPVSVILTFAVLLVLLATDAGFRDDDFQKGSLWFVVGVGAFTGLQFLPGDWHLPFLDRAWWQTAIAAISFGLGFDSVLGENEPLRERIGTFVAAIALATFIALATRWIPEPNWTTGFVAIGVSLMLILAVVDVPAAVLILLGYSLIALTGGVVANYHGAILNLTFFGFLFLIWVAVEKSWLVRENELVKGVVVRGQIAADRTLKLLDRIILSPCLWRIAAIGRRFPWRHNRFISFCKEAFLLKQSSQECEFVHRLLRDYFALLELRPRLSASDKHRRLDAIRFLGYQGEAALDVLEEFAGDQDPSVRAAALIGLSHISSPIVTRYFELRMDDPNPLVRQAIIRGIFRLPRKDFAELLSRLQPLGDGCELAPLLDALQSDDSFVHIGKIYEVIKKLGKVAMEPMKGRLRSRNRRVREEFVGALAQFFNEEQQQLLSRDVDGEFPWLDPTKPISRSRVIHCGRHLGLTEGDVLARYQALADEFGLKIKL